MSTPQLVVDLPLWRAVMDLAGSRCQCSGACGNTHTKTKGRCDRVNGTPARRHGGRMLLLAAPAAPAELHLPAHIAAALPASRLAAWCPACHDGARKHTTPAPAGREDTAPSLF